MAQLIRFTAGGMVVLLTPTALAQSITAVGRRSSHRLAKRELSSGWAVIFAFLGVLLLFFFFHFVASKTRKRAGASATPTPPTGARVGGAAVWQGGQLSMPAPVFTGNGRQAVSR